MRPGVLLAKLPPGPEDDRLHGSVTGRGGGVQRQGEEGGDRGGGEGEEKG